MTHHLDGGSPRLLPGEDVLEATPEEVTSWITIYEELAAVMRAVIARAGEPQDSGRVREVKYNPQPRRSSIT